ncbi:MAG: secretin N-terminal domain-containing protein [Phycisphaerae bacterium]
MGNRFAKPWSLAVATILIGVLAAGVSIAAEEENEAPPPESNAAQPSEPEAASPAEQPAPSTPADDPAPENESSTEADQDAKPTEASVAEEESKPPAPPETKQEGPAPSGTTPAEAPPAPAPETKEKPSEDPAAKRPEEIRFQFDGIPYNEVIRRFAQACGKPIIGEYNVEGTLTFFDPRPYTPDEAFDTLNLILAMKGHALVETERFVRVVPIKEMTKAPVPILRGWDDTDDLRPGELATVMLPLKFMTAEDAVRVLMPVVSTFGSVAPLGTGRGIIVTDRAQNLKRIRLILDELDTGTLSAETVLKTYTLKHAAAGDVQKVIEDLFASAAQMLSKMRYIRDKNGRMVRNPNYGKPPPKGEDDLVATSDPRTNTLFLSGPGDKIALAEQVVEQLDSISPEQTGDMRVFDLQNARAEDLANTVKQLLPDDGDRRRWPPGRGDSGMESRVVADPNTNRLIVTASLDRMARIEELIRTLDQASQEVGGMRVFRLKVADARQLAEVVSHAVRRGGERRDRYGRDRSAMGSAVSADSRTNSLIVSGNAADIQRAEQLITELDRPLDAQTREVHVVPLAAGDADDIADALNRMLSHGGGGDGRRSTGPVHIAAEDDTNTLFISAGPEDWPRIQKILDDLEASVAPQATSTTRMLPLKHADAGDVEDALNDIYRPKMMAKARMNRGEPFVPVIIAAAERSNALIVSGPDDEQKAIAELVQSMDTPQTEAAEKVHVVQLKDGDAVRIADTLRDLQPRRDDRAVIRGDADSNTILIRASDEEFQGIKALIDELDQTITTSGGIQAFRLKVADAEQLVGILRSALSQRRGERRYEEGGPVVTADSRTNSLLVSGTAADIQTARQLVEQLDHAPQREAREIHVVPLETGDADDIANALNRMLTHSAAGGRRTAGTVHVAAEDDTNTLFISAAPDDWAAIEKMLEELKASAAPHQMATTRHLQLQHAEAEEVARTLRQLYASEESSSRSSRYSRYRRRSTRDGRSVPVTIAANERTNSLLISASDEDQQTIGEMIQALDVPKEEGTAPVRIIRLASADADKLAETLRAALPKRTEPGAEPIVIQADSRAGALLIRAPEAERKRLEEMIETLDEATQAQVRETRMIELKHTAASKLAQMFSQLYAAGSAGSSYSRYSSHRSDDANRVVVAAAPGDKTLVVEAPRRKMQEIVDLVTSLDVEEATDGIQVRTYRMEDSEAEDLARSLARLMAEQRGSAPAGEPRARFEADEGTNQLMVAATAEQFKTIEALIQELQTPVQVTQEMKTFHLKAAKADDVVRVLRTMLLGETDDDERERWRSEPPAVRLASVDETNDVVVRAPPDQLALAAQLIDMLDTEAAGTKAAVVIVPLKNAQAVGLAQSLNEVLTAEGSSSSRSSRYSRYRRYRRSSGSDNDRVTVTAEPNSNSLLVRGPADAIPPVVEMIRELDAGATGMGAEVRVYPLENSEPYELVQSLRSLFTDMLEHESARRGGKTEIPFSVAADARTRSLVVSTTPAHFTLVEQILESLDKAPAAPEADVQYIWLENADATAVADQLNAMYEDHKGTKPVIAADEFSNSLTVIAKDEEMKVIEPIVAKLDEASGSGRRIRVVPLMDVQAGRMAELLRTVYKQLTGNEVRITSEAPEAPGGTPGPAGESGPPAPAGDAEAPAKTPAEAPAAPKPEEPAGDTAPAAAPAEAPDTVDEADPTAADDAGEAASKSPVTITVDQATNSLILSGSRQEVEYLESLIDELSLTAMDVEAEFRSFKIEKADPQSVARTLDELFNPKPKPLPKDYKGPPPPSPPPVINVVSDPRTRLVIVRAKPVDFTAVEELVKQLDQVPTVVSEVRIFHLKHTAAKDVAQNLRDLFQRAAQQRTAPQKQPQKKSQDQGKGKRPTPQKQRAEMIREVLELKTQDGVTQVDLASMVNVSANEPTNSVIVTAPADAMGIVADIVEELDQSAQGDVPSVRLYPIAHGDVAPMVKELREVFAEDRKQKGKPTPDVVITGDEAARTVVVSAPADEHERIGEVIRELDQAQAAGDVTVQVYRLENADATTIAAALTETVKRTEKGERGGPGEVRISADRSGNSVVVRAAAEDHERIGRLIQDMDTVPEAVIKTYPVKNAQVQTVVEALKQVFAPRKSAGAGAGARGRAHDEVVVSGDEAGRLIVVSAPEAKHVLVKKVLDELDSAQSEEQVIVKVYRLKHAEADDVAEALQNTLQQASGGTKRSSSPRSYWSRYQPREAPTGQVRINPDESSNSIIVRASAEDHERIEALLKELDVAPAEQYAIRLIPLENADPEEVETVLERVFESGGRRRYGWGRSSARETVIIEANPDAGMIAVRADDEAFEKIRALVEEMDQASTGTDLAPTLIPLKFAQAAAVAEAVSDAFQAGRRTSRGTSARDHVSVVAEPGSNSLIVTANAENLEKVRGLLAKLDTEESGGVTSEMLLLENAQAEDLAPVLQQMAEAASGGTSRSRWSGASAAGAAQQSVAVSAEKGSNALVISGPAAQVKRLTAMARDLDQATSGTASTVHVIQLENGEATEVASMVQDLYRQQYLMAMRQRRNIEPLAVSADARANALVLAAGDEMFKQVSEWVKQIETMQPARGTLRIINLKHADPAEVEAAIQRLFGEEAGRGVVPVRRSRPAGTSSYRSRGARGEAGPAGNAGPAGQVETTVLPQQKAILISASEEDFEAIKQLAETLDEAAADARRQFQVFALEHTSNTKIATALASLYRQTAAARPEDQVTVTALPDTNAVVVSATEARLEEVGHLIEQLDREEIAPQLEFRIVQLQNAQPTKVLPILEQMLTQVRQTRPDEPVDVQADERTRSIIVTARGTMFEQVERIIQTLDQRPAFAGAEVLIIPLKKADATRLAEVLNDMLRPSPATQVTPEARALQEQVRLLQVRSADGRKIPELDLTQPIKITSDPVLAGQQGANALLISSTPDNLKAMAAIVDVLDTVPVAEGTRVRVVHLKNADAASVSDILADIFEQGERLAGKPESSVEGRAEPESTSGKALTNPLNVSADPRTNSLVLSGVEESLALADIIIADLDRDAGTLVTEVRLFRLKHASAERLAPMLEAVFAEAQADPPGAEGLRTQVTRLRTVLKEKIGHVTERAKAREALSIQADPTTNIIVVAARSDVMPLIADVVDTMDVPGAGSLTAVRIFPLENADATRLKDLVDGLYAGPNAQFVRPEDVPTVTVDTRTNALVVSASESTFVMIDTLLKRLDAEQPIELREIRLVNLKNAEAASLAPVLQEMMDARVQRLETLGAADAEALRMIIAADERSNSLIVGGSAEGFKIVEGLAAQLDGASPAISGQIQILPLEHANAGTLSASLANLFDERYAAARTEDVRRQKPVILPDLRINALLVAANADDSKILKSLLEKLDVELTDPAVRLTVVPLRFNDAGIVGPTLEDLFASRLESMTPPGQEPMPQDRVDVAIDALSNSLIISASKENLGLIQDLLKKVDVAPPDETGIVRLYPLKTADAQRVATMLEALISQGFYKPGVILAGDSTLVQAREKVAIAVDVRTNVLIVSASKENFAVIEEIIRTVDSTEDFSVLGDIRLFTLENADATRLAPTLQQLFDAKRQAEVEAGSAGRMLPVSVIPDGRTNTLLVTGSRESLKALEVMIQDLDAEQVLLANEFKVFYLQNATATVLQPTLEQVFAQRVTRGEAPAPVTNALLVSGSPDDLRLAESLIERLDAKPDRPGTAVRVFPLKKGDATQVAETLRTLYEQPGAAAAATVGISVDERINAILVSAGPADLERMEQLVEELDTDSVPRVTEIRVFTLENADAAELAQILNDALNQKPDPLTEASPNRQALLQFISRTEDEAEQVASALQEGVLITPDTRTNSLVISAPTENMRLLENLVRAMDDTQPRTAEIRVFTLVNSDARAMAQVLSELFRMGQTAADRQAVEYRLMAEKAEADGAAARVGSAQDAALTVTVDVRTNSLLVGGTRHYVALASEVIQELDQSTASERLTEVYRLRNAQAADIETAVSNFLSQERDVLEQSLGEDAGGTLPFILEREVAIVAESTSNTLLLSASPRYYQVIADMIEELDRPPPQVLIQVLLADVTIDDTEEFGIEWNVQERWRSHDVFGGTAPAFSASAGLTLNPGFTVSVTGGDANFLLRAIEAQGRVEILSRPQVLATDNQLATINIGQRVPFITNSRITEDGTTINTIQYEDVGIILNVTPRITPDGFVRMEVNPEISSIDDSTVPISENVNAIIVNSRSAETTVTVQDGHTIVVGGLIRTTDRDRVNKVPVLGDVPLLGNLFRSTRKVKERTELLIILTPTVLQNTGDVDAQTEREVQRLNLLRASHDGGVRDKTFDEYGERMFEEFRLQGTGAEEPGAGGGKRPEGADASQEGKATDAPDGPTLAVPARREDRSP